MAIQIHSLGSLERDYHNQEGQGKYFEYIENFQGKPNAEKRAFLEKELRSENKKGIIIKPN